MNRDRFSHTVFLLAGIYGLIVLLPGYFGEKMLAERMPPAVNHPEFYYGFLGVAVAWQVTFLVIAGDPARLRPIIPAAVLEKLAYAIACLALLLTGRVPVIVAVVGGVDFVWGVLFVVAYSRLRAAEAAYS